MAQRFPESRSFLVLDIETIPDVTLPWDAAVDGFPPAPFHQVVSLGVLWLGGDYGFKRMGTFGGDGSRPIEERQILEEFTEFIDQHRPNMVTFNGRGFDLPVLVNRCMRHGVQFQAYFADRDYRYRFSDVGHIDIAEVLTDYGASRKPRLDSLAQLVGMPGKMDVDGSKVSAMFEQGKHKEIQDYCLHDVVQTTFVFLRTELLRGRMNPDGYRAAASQLWTALEDDERVAEVLRRADRGRALLVPDA